MSIVMKSQSLAGAPEASAPREHMQAVVQERYGDSTVLSIEVIERPTINADQVLIEVYSAALDRGTEHLMTGTPWLIRLAGYGVTKPKNPVPGLDVAGTVVAVGSEVTRFDIGDEVFGIAQGSFAEFAAAQESKLSHKPESLSFDAAAGASVSGTTALQALTDVGQLEPGQRVLVIGASGGVGSFAVQLAAALGASVDGIAGTDNLELVRSLGAENVFDHRTTTLDQIEQSYDLVLDIGGRNTVHALRGLLTRNGTLVIVGGENGNRITGGIGRQLLAVALSPFISQRLTMFIATEHHSFIDRLAVHLESGDVISSIGSRFSLDQAAAAMGQLESGQASGKTIIQVKGTQS